MVKGREVETVERGGRHDQRLFGRRRGRTHSSYWHLERDSKALVRLSTLVQFLHRAHSLLVRVPARRKHHHQLVLPQPELSEPTSRCRTLRFAPTASASSTGSPEDELTPGGI